MIDPQKIWSSSQLPTLPGVAIRLLELSKNPDADLREVVELMRTDPAITAKVLKSTNSSYFGFRSEVTSLERAIPLLGTTVVTSLALSFSLVEAAMTSGPLARHYRAYWMQSIVQAAAAEVIGEQFARGVEGEYLLAGLLVDLGRLAMLKTIGREYQPVLDAAEEQQRPVREVERERLGIDHVETGVRLMENWKLPRPLIDATRLHHAPVEELRAGSDPAHTVLVQAAATAAAVGDFFCAADKASARERLTQLAGEFYRIGPAALDEFIAQVKDRSEQTGELLSISTEELGDPGELMARANEQLAQLAVREHVAGTQAVARQQAMEREKQDLESRNQELQQRALHDPLTKLYNRRFFEEALQNEIRRCCRSAASIGLIFIDIDHFKRLNDTWGHQFGDKVLQQIAQMLSDTARRSDILARYGGEEFVLMAVQPTEKGMHKIAERVRAGIEAVDVFHGEERIPVTASVGAAVTVPRRDEDDLAERLIAAADEAMYDSKRNGRNQVHLRCLTDDRNRRLAQQSVQRRFSRWLVNRQVLDIPTVSRALLVCESPHVRLGTLALQQGRLSPPQIQQILEEQLRTNGRFGETAVRLGFLSDEHLAQLLAMQQEEPIGLGRILVRLGLLQRQQVATLLTEYLSEGTSRVALVAPTPV